MKNLKQMFGKKSDASFNDSTTKSEHQSHEHSNKKEGYQCPMKCEGDKVYQEPGNCPVCNMKLVPVNEIKGIGHH